MKKIYIEPKIAISFYEECGIDCAEVVVASNGGAEYNEDEILDDDE